jgi:hypothetical protein
MSRFAFSSQFAPAAGKNSGGWVKQPLNNGRISGKGFFEILKVIDKIAFFSSETGKLISG